MGCVHADGGNPRYVCNECEKDEPGLRARNRGWVRGDVLPETTGDLTIQDMIDINKAKFESHGTETERFSTKAPNVCQAPSALAFPEIPHKLVGQRVPLATGGERYNWVCVKCHREWEKNIYMPASSFPQDCTHEVVDSPHGKIAMPLTAQVPIPDQLEAERTKPFKLPGYGEQLFTFKTVDLTKLSEYERGRRKGSQEMLDMIRGSLKGFPDLGGDIEVIREIERIIAEATCYWRDEVAQLRETISNIRKEIEKLRVQV